MSWQPHVPHGDPAFDLADYVDQLPVGPPMTLKIDGFWDQAVELAIRQAAEELERQVELAVALQDPRYLDCLSIIDAPPALPAVASLLWLPIGLDR